MRHFKFSMIAITLLTLLNFSCKKEVEGCLDKKADNYNPNATINVDCKFTGCTDKEAENYDIQANVSGNCIYARDKFIGKYDGTLACPGTNLGFLSGMTTFTIDEDIAGGKNSVNVLVKTTSGLTVPVKGVCKNNVLSLDTDVKGVTVTVGGLTTVVDVKAVGDIIFDPTAKTLTGPLKLDVTSLILGTLSDSCSFTGKKQ
jgi:hypothetical protein